MTRLQCTAAAIAFALVLARRPGQTAQQDPSLLSVKRIYGSPDFAPERFGPARWLERRVPTRRSRRQETGKGRTSCATTPNRANARCWCPPRRSRPPGDTAALDVEDYGWSPDGTRLLVFTNSQPVWRSNTRGDYWVLDRASGKLRKLGGPEAKPSTLLFAKFSPDGGRVGYVRENNLYVEDLATGAITQLTTDGPEDAHQRHLRLGVRGRARPARRLALEPGREAHRLLAAQR